MCEERLELALVPGSTVLLILSGQITCVCSGRSYGAGEVFAPEDKCVLRGSARLWQITGKTGSLSSLSRFSAQLVRKDPATAAHTARVARLAAATGRYLQLQGAHLERLSLAAYLHDLGKLALPNALLRIPAPLTRSERALMREHPHGGKRLLEMTPLAFLGAAVAQHHERFDGSGYPFGLRGDEVGRESYVIAVADTFDTITNDRPYRRAQSLRWALSELNRYSDVFYPREVVTAFGAAVKSFAAYSGTPARADAVEVSA